MVTVASAAAAHPGRMTNHSAPDLAVPAGTALPARGVVRADVTRDEIDPAAPAAQVVRASAGAVVTFSGFVRDHDDGRAVVGIEDVAHPSAGRVLARVAADLAAPTAVGALAVSQRVGGLGIGECAVAVAVSAALLVDEVKHQVPVWKGQVFADGSDEWVACPQHRCGAGCRWSHPDYHPTGAHRAANLRERRDMKSVDQHLADLLDGVGPLEPVDADVLDALGAVLPPTSSPWWTCWSSTPRRSAHLARRSPRPARRSPDSRVAAWAVTCAYIGFGESLRREVSYRTGHGSSEAQRGLPSPPTAAMKRQFDLPASRTATHLSRGPTGYGPRSPRCLMSRGPGALRLRRSGASMISNEYPYPLGFGDSCLALDLSVGIR